jgi:type IV pilus assembly protein PilC
MATFDYTAIDARGAVKTGRHAAADVAGVVAWLRTQGLAPTAVNAVGAVGAGPERLSESRWQLEWRWPGSRAVGRKEVAVFTRQLATLLRAGMPLLRGLEVLARQERQRGGRDLLNGLAAEIRAGGTLSASLARQPEIFDRLYVNMVRAGEAGGSLAVVLERLAGFLEKSRQWRSKVRAAMLYPVLVLLVAAGILSGLLVFVVPKFQQLYADLLKGAPLPPLTQMVMAVSLAVKNHFGIGLGVVVLVVVAARLYRRSERGRGVTDAALLRLPVIGEFMLKGVVARLARTFGTLLASGVPILPALQISRDACANARVAAALTQMHQQVKAGATVAAAVDATRVFPPLVASLLEVGEHTGELPTMLGRIADIYDEEVDHTVAGLSSLIEPVLILFLALVVGTIVIALFLPIVRIVQLMT